MTKRKNFSSNTSKETIKGFGEEWTKFDQSNLPELERENLFNSYFSIFPWKELPKNSIGFDAGCGTGRWALLVAPRVGKLHCIDPSSAIEVAKKNLSKLDNCYFHRSPVDSMDIEDKTMDFGYSLGVLHHVPDTQQGINDCVKKLKSGAPFLIYLYYALENRPLWYRSAWRLSDFLRNLISRLPFSLRYFVCKFLALVIYWPLSRFSLFLEKLSIDVSSFPLSAYRSDSFYRMRTDSLDRFGTKLEKRFSADQIEEMMILAGLTNISFRSSAPYWCALGYKKG